MKELRFSAFQGEWRLAFAFDPERAAILLVAGDKSGGSQTRFYGELARKTEHMVRQTVASYGPIVAGKQVEFDLQTLKALQAKAGDEGSDNQTIINFVRAIETEANDKAAEMPVLVDIAARAQMVMTALEQRTLNTEQAMAQIELLVKERGDADAERQRLGLDALTFSIYWQLNKSGLKDPLGIAADIVAAINRFANHLVNDDELRQLKAAIYAALLKEVSGQTMVRLGDAVLRVVGVRR